MSASLLDIDPYRETNKHTRSMRRTLPNTDKPASPSGYYDTWRRQQERLHWACVASSGSSSCSRLSEGMLSGLACHLVLRSSLYIFVQLCLVLYRFSILR